MFRSRFERAQVRILSYAFFFSAVGRAKPKADFEVVSIVSDPTTTDGLYICVLLGEVMFVDDDER